MRIPSLKFGASSSPAPNPSLSSASRMAYFFVIGILSRFASAMILRVRISFSIEPFHSSLYVLRFRYGPPTPVDFRKIGRRSERRSLTHVLEFLRDYASRKRSAERVCGISPPVLALRTAAARKKQKPFVLASVGLARKTDAEAKGCKTHPQARYLHESTMKEKRKRTTGDKSFHQ
jgi:hypothetical protein